MTDLAVLIRQLQGDAEWLPLVHIVNSQDLAGAPCELLRRAGLVMVTGSVQVTAAHAAFSTIAQLPAGFWPGRSWRPMQPANIGGVETFCGVRVQPDGQVMPRLALGVNDWVSLSMTFPMA